MRQLHHVFSPPTIVAALLLLLFTNTIREFNKWRLISRLTFQGPT